MATYTKETALYDTGAIAGDIQEAGTTATNFLSADSSGIMIYDGTNGAQTPSNPNADTNNVFIDSDSLDIRKGTEVLATFSAEETRVGSRENSSISLNTEGIAAIKSDGTEYFQVGLGSATVTQTATASEYFQKTSESYAAAHLNEDSYSTLYGLINNGDVFDIEVTIHFGFRDPRGNWNDHGRTWRLWSSVVSSSDRKKGTSYLWSDPDADTSNAKCTSSMFYNATTNIFFVGYSSAYFNERYGQGGYSIHGATIKLMGEITTPAPSYSFGINTNTSKALGFAIGKGTAPSVGGFACGKYNNADNANNYAFILGNGASDNSRSDALTVDWNGNIDAAGGIAIDGNITAGGTISAVNNAFTVDSSGNVSTSRGITVWNHGSQIGDRVQKEGGTDWTTNVTSSADAWIQLGNISLTIGRWIIVARARFTPTSSGNHYSSINISTTNKLEAVRDRRYGTGTYYNQHSTSMILSLASDATVYVNGMASVAGTWTRTNNSAFTIDAIRIM